MSLAAVDHGRANVRIVNTFYKNTAFYITANTQSGKMKDLSSNPSAAVCYNLFVAHGAGVTIGHPLAPENRELREELQRVFSAFYDKHVDENDENTALRCFCPEKPYCLLYTEGILIPYPGCGKIS